jgi:hypothetical protein
MPRRFLDGHDLRMSERTLVLLAAVVACADNLSSRHDDRADRYFPSSSALPSRGQSASHKIDIVSFHRSHRDRTE